ncbi:MAG: hypothetical protein ACE5K8_05675 [Candidatus Zixiibacteriota bacterium]
MSELSAEQFETLIEMNTDSTRFASAEAESPFDQIHLSEDETDDVWETGDACCRYWNAATCPDCAAGMVRLGSCLCCQSCGYETCAA